MKSGRMRVEDVAALWQSEESLAEDKSKIENFDSHWRSEDYLKSVADEEYKKQLAAAPAAEGDITPDSSSALRPMKAAPARRRGEN